MLSIPRCEVLLPEDRDILFCIFIVKFFWCADNCKTLFFRNSVIHRITAFQWYCQFQRGKDLHHCFFLTDWGRSEAMKACECFGETVGRIVSVFQSKFSHRAAAKDQFIAREREPAVTNVFHKWISAQHAESFVEIKRRDTDVPCDIIYRNIVGNMGLDIIYGFFDDRCPFHSFCLRSRMW